MTNQFSFFIHAGYTGYMLTVLLNIRWHLIILRIEKEFMEFFHVVFKRLRHHTVSYFANIKLSSGSRETVCITHMVILDIPCKRNQIRQVKVCRHLWNYCLKNTVQRNPVGRFCFFKCLVQNNTLAFRTGIVRISQSQTSVSNRLYTV